MKPADAQYNFAAPQEVVRDKVKYWIDHIINDLRQHDQSAMWQSQSGFKYFEMASVELERAGYVVRRHVKKDDLQKIERIEVQLP